MAETSPVLVDSELTGQIIDGAIEVHRLLGPGLLESAYRTCLETELRLRGLKVDAEVPVPLTYKGQPLNCNSTRLMKDFPRLVR
jgi:GxxExxY protein